MNEDKILKVFSFFFQGGRFVCRVTENNLMGRHLPEDEKALGPIPQEFARDDRALESFMRAWANQERLIAYQRRHSPRIFNFL